MYALNSLANLLITLIVLGILVLGVWAVGGWLGLWRGPRR